MNAMLTIVRQQFLGAIALVIVVGGVGFAATGGNLKLGMTNNADKKTVVKNTGTGPAMEFQAKSGQPPIKVSNTKQIPNLNASLLRGKAPNSFATAGSSYTKAQSDGKYALTGAAYTKAQSDGKYALTGAAYTKSQSDGKYALTGAAYTKSQSDGKYALTGAAYTKSQSDGKYAPAGSSYTKTDSDTRYYTKTQADDRYGRILHTGSFSGQTNMTGTETTIHTQDIAVPGPGILVFIAGFTSTTGNGTILRLYVEGSERTNGGVHPDDDVVTLQTPFAVDGGDTITVSVRVYGQNGSQVGGSGNVVVVFYPL